MPFASFCTFFHSKELGLDEFLDPTILIPWHNGPPSCMISLEEGQ